MRPRRRRKRSQPRRQSSGAPEEEESSGRWRKERRSRRRKKRRQDTQRRCLRVFCLLLGAACLIVWVSTSGLGRQSSERHGGFLRASIVSFLSSGRQSDLLHLELYNRIWNSAKDIQIESGQTSAPYERRPYNLTSTYGESVMHQGCNLSVVVMDPRFATLDSGSPGWFSLESVGAFIPHACVLVQTAFLSTKELLEGRTGRTISNEAAMAAVSIHIYDNSLPLFRRMIENGRVRLTFPDHKKYNLLSSSDFGNPSAAFMNANFWKDEFIENVDSDHVLVLQDDAVLCNRLNASDWNAFAYVGAVWPREANPLAPVPPEGMCRGMPGRWNTFTLSQRRWERQQARNLEDVESEKRYYRPTFLVNTSFPGVCDNGLGPIGNGGLSLRSRSWLIKAIETCPHVRHSGLNLSGGNLACKVVEAINEDFYFGTVLYGMGAPMPSAYFASLFATEMLWPEQVLEMYGVSGEPYPSAESAKIEYRGNTVTIPAGLHKPWWYQSEKLLQSDGMARACPFLKYIYDPAESKWQEFQESAPWIGTGY